MIHEYAVDPDTATSWGRDAKDYRYFYGRFGYGQPRVVSAYPSKRRWRQTAREAIRTSDTAIQQARSTEMITILLETMTHRYMPTWSENVEWVENAEAEHSRQNFKLVIAGSNPRSRAYVRDPGQLTPGDADWDVSAGDPVDRTPSDLAAALSPVLSIAGTITIVDPFFSPDNAGKTAILKAYLGVCCSRAAFQLPKVTLHVKTRDNYQADENFEAECKRILPNIVPRGLELTIRRWNRKPHGPNIHNRYVLTELGGVQLGQSMQPDQSDQDDVTIMSRTQYLERWKQFQTNIDSHFSEITPSVRVTGS